METKALVIVEGERVLYRYEDSHQYSDMGYREPYLHKFLLVRETEKSYFIRRFMDPDKRVPKTGKNIFAWDTEEKALFNYIKRKQRHKSILQGKLNEVKRNLHFAEDRMAKLKQTAEENPVTTILNQFKNGELHIQKR